MDLLDLGNSEPQAASVIEMTLMTKRTVNVFTIPPMSSSKGHKAEDWHGK